MPSSSRLSRFSLGLFTIVTALPLLIAIALALFRPESSSWTFVFFLTAMIILMLFFLSWIARPERVAIPASLLVFMILWPEVGLRAAGFEYRSAGVVQFGFPRPERMVTLDRDPELFWKLKPEDEVHNRYGFMGRDWVIPKPDNMFRVVFFGDSCTYQPYPFRVVGNLRKAAPKRVRIDGCNLGVPGYSSHQGRILVERWAQKLEPDVATVYFGWNDHWQAWGATDAQKAATYDQDTPTTESFLRHSALLQWLFKTSTHLLTPQAGQPLGIPRVSADEYRTNLLAMIGALKRTDAEIVLITAPSSHHRLGVPDYLVDRGLATDKKSVVALHQRYLDVVREVAVQTGVRLLDLAKRADKVEDPKTIFASDGIHYHNQGLEWIAEEIAKVIIPLVPR